MERREFIKRTGAAAATFGGACASVTGSANKLAYLGGTPVMAPGEHKDGIENLFAWPIVNDAMRKASDAVLVAHKMSGRDITKKFQEAFAKWQGSRYGLACINGTTALNTAFYCVSVQRVRLGGHPRQRRPSVPPVPAVRRAPEVPHGNASGRGRDQRQDIRRPMVQALRQASYRHIRRGGPQGREERRS